MPIAVPTVPWLQEFAPGDRVRFVRAYTGRHGTVVERPAVGDWADGLVFVDLDDLDEGGVNPKGCPPGFLRPLR